MGLRASCGRVTGHGCAGQAEEVEAVTVHATVSIEPAWSELDARRRTQLRPKAVYGAWTL